MDLFCPVTGLRVFSRSEWINKKVSDTFVANFYIIGNSIIYSSPAGRADLKGVQNSAALKEEVAKHISDGNEPYIQIQDYAALNGSNQAARGYFITSTNEDERLLSMIFCNLSTPLSIAVKIGNRFNTTGKNIQIAKHYEDAIRQALELCNQHNLKQNFPVLDPSICINSSDRSLTPIQVMSDNAWDIQTPELSNRTLIIDRCILHSISEGNLEAKHIPLLDRMRHMCQAALPKGSSIEYFVADASQLKGASRAARIKYMQSLKDWHQQFPIQMYILYKANTFMRTAAYLARPLLPFKIKIAQDFNHAFDIIRENKLGLSSKKQTRQKKADAPDPNLEDIEKLLAFISSINWEQEGIESNFDVAEQRSFSILFQSIRLIKEEIDGLFAERNKTVEALQDSNTQLQIALAELKQTQEKMIQQERLAAVGQLAAGIAHDFNNILTTIMGFSELMQLVPDTPESMQSDLQKISASSQRAAYLVRQLLDFSRKTIRHPKQFDLTSFTKEFVIFLERIIPENIQINLNLEPGNYLIEADPTQLQQVITNLVINARDAMPSGGKLEVGLSRIKIVDEENCVICDQAINGEWICLTVADTGSGIAADILPHIFEPFFTTKAVDEGTGLGLSQVYGIISQHAGHIVVNSQIDQGTTITIYLPLALKQNGKMAEQISPTMPLGHGERILLVEDEPAVLEINQAMLEYLGYQVMTAINGQEALAIYREHRTEIALILSDMVMPEMTGEALFHTLKAENPNIKMVMMSGYPLGEKGAELLEKGVVDWFEKPISFGPLSQVVDKALSK